MKNGTREQWFHSKVDRRGERECWKWLGATNKSGYGCFGWLNGRMILAHRFAYLQANGNLPKDKCVCHTCDNPICVNPSHLFAGSASDNWRDSHSKGRSSTPPVRRGESHYRSKLTAGHVMQIRRTYAMNKHSQRALARMFGVAQTTIGRIVSIKSWRDAVLPLQEVK